jgi:hypothetical protein
VHFQAQFGSALDPPEPGGSGAGDQPEQLPQALDVAVGWLDLQDFDPQLEGPSVGDDRPAARLPGWSGGPAVRIPRTPACQSRVRPGSVYSLNTISGGAVIITLTCRIPMSPP